MTLIIIYSYSIICANPVNFIFSYGWQYTLYKTHCNILCDLYRRFLMKWDGDYIVICSKNNEHSGVLWKNSAFNLKLDRWLNGIIFIMSDHQFLAGRSTSKAALPITMWRHNERDGVSNHQRLDCLLNRLFRCRSKKTSQLCVTGLSEGISPVTGEFFSERASYAENASIWWRHHAHKVLIMAVRRKWISWVFVVMTILAVGLKS